jgi:hypothetical protein
MRRNYQDLGVSGGKYKELAAIEVGSVTTEIAITFVQ